MKRLAIALVAVLAMAVGVEAGSIFEADRLLNHIGVYHDTHYLRGSEKGKKHGGSSKSQAEARQTTPPPSPSPKPSPQPARAD